MVRLLITDALRDEGFHLDIADNVAGALALLATASYDLVLTDGRLPDGTGLDVAERATECGTRVLLYTGYAQRVFFVTSHRSHGRLKTVEDNRTAPTYSSTARPMLNCNN